MNVHLNTAPIIEGFQTSPPSFTPSERETITAALAQLSALNLRAKKANAEAIIEASRTICDRYAAGKASLDEMLGLAQISQGISDELARSLAARASEAINRAERAILRELQPLVIAALTHRAEEIRLACNRIESREQEDAEIAGIDHQPSELLRRMQSTFRAVQARVRELRDGQLPSRAEARDL